MPQLRPVNPLKTAIITGASSGIGAAAARQLAELGWSVAVVGRDAERTRSVAASVSGTPFVVDFDRLDNVRALADQLLSTYPQVNALLNNAGGLNSARGVTPDGHEQTFQRNYLAPFLLTNLLATRLVDSGARVISTSSVANRRSDLRLDDLDWEKRPWLGGWRAYGTTKLETNLFIRELARRTGLEAFAVHPGYVSTRFGMDSALVRLADVLRPGGFGMSAARGALPLVRVAVADQAPAPSGTYFDRHRARGAEHRSANDPSLAKALWEKSTELVGL
jgi:NAD(P)-dependent dehydrogenase (short-subunit alcohol dehydrogenase family)